LDYGYVLHIVNFAILYYKRKKLATPETRKARLLCTLAEERKMGSIEVYDAKLVKRVPYVPHYEKLIQHFKDTSEERASPNHMGRYIVGTRSKSRNSTTPSVPPPVKVNLVTPVS
jgi:hypothetical protein